MPTILDERSDTMGGPGDAGAPTQGDLEILLARELRRAGLDLPLLRVRRRDPLPRETGRWTMLLDAVLRTPTAGDLPVLVRCESRDAPLDAAVLRASVAEAAATDARRAILVSTAGFTADAVRLAGALGVPLLEVVAGASAWRASPWAASSRPPAWFPEWVTRLVTPGEAGLVHAELLAGGRPDAILARLRVLEPPVATGGSGC